MINVERCRINMMKGASANKNFTISRFLVIFIGVLFISVGLSLDIVVADVQTDETRAFTPEDFPCQGGDLPVDVPSYYFSLGDLNLDLQIDAADALLILQYAVDLVKLENDRVLDGDVDGNGLVDARDALLVLRYAVRDNKYEIYSLFNFVQKIREGNFLDPVVFQ